MWLMRAPGTIPTSVACPCVCLLLALYWTSSKTGALELDDAQLLEGPVLKAATKVCNDSGGSGLVERHEGVWERSGCVGWQAAGDGGVVPHVLGLEAVEVVSAGLGRGSCGALGAGTTMRRYVRVSKEHGNDRHTIVEDCAHALSEADWGSRVETETDMAKVCTQRFKVWSLLG